jgi:hypothetical protein
VSIQAFAPRVLDPESLGQFPRLAKAVRAAIRAFNRRQIRAVPIAERAMSYNGSSENRL